MYRAGCDVRTFEVGQMTDAVAVFVVNFTIGAVIDRLSIMQRITMGFTDIERGRWNRRCRGSLNGRDRGRDWLRSSRSGSA